MLHLMLVGIFFGIAAAATVSETEGGGFSTIQDRSQHPALMASPPTQWLLSWTDRRTADADDASSPLVMKRIPHPTWRQHGRVQHIPHGGIPQSFGGSRNMYGFYDYASRPLFMRYAKRYAPADAAAVLTAPREEDSLVVPQSRFSYYGWANDK